MRRKTANQKFLDQLEAHSRSRKARLIKKPKPVEQPKPVERTNGHAKNLKGILPTPREKVFYVKGCQVFFQDVVEVNGGKVKVAATGVDISDSWLRQLAKGNAVAGPRTIRKLRAAGIMLNRRPQFYLDDADIDD